MTTETQSEQIPHGLRNGRGWLESIRDMITRYDAAEDDNVREEVEREIQESPLSVEWRGGWVTDRSQPADYEECKILLSTGGPALRLLVDLPDADRPRLEWQDWGTPWTEIPTTTEDDAALTRFACIIGVDCY